MPLHVVRFLLADNPFHKDALATCGLRLKVKSFFLALALLLELTLILVFHKQLLNPAKSSQANTHYLVLLLHQFQQAFVHQ